MRFGNYFLEPLKNSKSWFIEKKNSIRNMLWLLHRLQLEAEEEAERQRQEEERQRREEEEARELAQLQRRMEEEKLRKAIEVRMDNLP